MVANAVGHAAVLELAEAIGSERRTAAVPHEPLASYIVVARDAHRGVDVEAIAVLAAAPLPLRLEREVSRRGGLADDIEQADFVVLTNFWSGWLEPNTSVQRQSQEHNQAIADNFCLVGQYESNLLLLFERCEGGGGISGADVDGRYPEIPVPEELAGS